jgi:sugar lactone lactonase YvrE
VEWKRDVTSGHVIAGGNGAGNRNDQLNLPIDVTVDRNTDCLIISDYGNGRVVRWPRRNGTKGETIISDVKCYGLTMDDNGLIYVCDYGKHEVRRWRIGETHGTLVAGGNGRGNRLDQLNHPRCIFVDHEYSVYVSDHTNRRVMKWVKDAKEGILVAGCQGQRNALTQLSGSAGVIVDQLGTVFVVDFISHRIMRWFKGATEGSIIVGEYGQGGQANQVNGPVGLSFDRYGNLYVVDHYNHRVQRFSIDRD